MCTYVCACTCVCARACVCMQVLVPVRCTQALHQSDKADKKSHQEGSDGREPLLALHGRPIHVKEEEVEQRNRKEQLLRCTQQFANTVSKVVKGRGPLVCREIKSMHTKSR